MNTTLTAFERQALSQELHRDIYARCESPSEWAIVSFIYDRTINWGKLDELIPFRHFLKGIGEWRPPVLVSRSTLIRTLDSLCARGVITRVNSRLGFVYRIVFDMAHLKRPKGKREHNTTEDLEQDDFAEDTAEPVINQPRRLKEARKRVRRVALPSEETGDEGPDTSLEGGVTVEPKGCHGDHIEERETERRETVGSDEPTLSAKNKVSGIIEKVNLEHRIERDKRQQARRAKPIHRPADVEAAWIDAMRDHFPKAPRSPWTGKLRGQAKLIGNRLASDEGSLIEFLEWYVAEWMTLRVTVFRWMDDAPEFPTLGLLVKFSDGIMSAYYRRATLDREARLTREQRARAKYRRLGYSEEEAENRARQETGDHDRSEDLDARERELQAREDRVRQAADTLAQHGTVQPAALDPIATRNKARSRILRRSTNGGTIPSKQGGK